MNTELTVFEQVEADIVAFEDVNAELVFDVTTAEGEKYCKEYLGKLRKVRNRIEKLRKETKKEYLDAGRAVDAEAKKYISRVESMHDMHEGPIKALEQKRLDAEIDTREKEQAELKAIEEKRIADLEAREAIMAAKEAEQKAKEDAFNAEANQAKHDKEIEDAKLVAAQEAIVKEQAAAHQRENDRIAAELAENNRLADIEDKRIADVEHCKEFNNLALDAIVAVTGDPASSLRLVKAIVKGEIPNVKMNY